MTPTVLVVDDSLTVRKDLEEAFTAVGVTTVLCASVAEARDTLARGDVQVVVLDVVLPDGDGVSFLHELRSDPRTAKLPVLLLSSEDEVGDRVRGVSTGADDYAGKPYDRTYVIARAQEWLRTRHPRARSAGPTVLVVDEDVSFGVRLREALGAAGGQVLLARSGEEGLRLAAATRPDAVIVSAVGPDIDGAALVRQLKLDAALRRTPCLLLTGANGPARSALEAGADSFVDRAESPAVISARIAALVRARRDARADEEGVDGQPSSFGPQKILSVDDSMTYLRVLSDEIRNEGYDVVLARSGEEALELLKAQPVDCILLDLVMPGLSGQETCRLIKSTPGLREIPLVVLSGADDAETKIDAFNVGADDYVTKRDGFEVIKARVRAQIRRKHMEAEARAVRERVLRKEKEAAEDAVRARDDFLAIAAHELRTPLATLTLHLEIMQAASACGDRGPPDAVDKAIRQTRRLISLVEGMLDVSRITTGRLALGREPVDLAEVAADVLQRFGPEASKAGSELSLQSCADAQGVWDRMRMDQIVSNLVANAISYGSGRPIEVAVTGDETHVRLTVRDHGIGISRADVARIFERFERAVPSEHYGGLGLGLYITRQIVEAHGGTIAVASEPGQGSLFTVTLPREPTPALAGSRPSATSSR